MRRSGTMLGVKCCRFSGEFVAIHPLHLFPVYVKIGHVWISVMTTLIFVVFRSRRENQAGLQ